MNFDYNLSLELQTNKEFLKVRVETITHDFMEKHNCSKDEAFKQACIMLAYPYMNVTEFKSKEELIDIAQIIANKYFDKEI